MTILPLEGFRIVEAAQMISAPFATAILSDQGADVIKVEAADGIGDRMRFLGDKRGGLASIFHTVNRGKRSITLNTKKAEGVKALLELIDTADVFIQNFRPGAIDRMGVGADVALARNPRLVFVSLSGFGQTGPYADQMVYDFVIQGYVGVAAREGSGGAHRLSRTYVIDKATALTTSQAITAALLQRERTGVGQHLEIDMLAAGLQFQWLDAMSNHTLLGDDIAATPNSGANYDVLATNDGYVTLNTASRFTWPRLEAMLDSPSISDDPRFQTVESRQEHGAELFATVAAILADLSSAEVIRRMRANDLPGGQSLDLDQIHLDPQVIHNGAILELDDGPIGQRREPRPAARFGAVAPEPAGPAPLLGADTNAVLAELGYTTSDLARLAELGVTRPLVA